MVLKEGKIVSEEQPNNTAEDKTSVETEVAALTGEREHLKVKLELFSGPLDLLLYLIRKTEVDIYDLKVAEIADQYGKYIEVLEDVDVNTAADFIEVYSTLIEIKSRLVLPKPVLEEEAEEEDEENPHTRLIKQLLEYKEFKDRSTDLEIRETETALRYGRIEPEQIPGEQIEPLQDVGLWDLIQAFGKVLNKVSATAPRTIQMDSTPVKVHMDKLHATLKEKKSVNFFELFDGKTDRVEVVGIFVAILELVRMQVMRCDQKDNFEDIWLVFIPPEERDEGEDEGETPEQ
jgi:segregation and condensation protein A